MMLPFLFLQALMIISGTSADVFSTSRTKQMRITGPAHSRPPVLFLPPVKACPVMPIFPDQGVFPVRKGSMKGNSISVGASGKRSSITGRKVKRIFPVTNSGMRRCRGSSMPPLSLSGIFRGTIRYYRASEPVLKRTRLRGKDRYKAPENR